VAGACWWVAVFASSDVQRWTLGGWSRGVLVVPDVLLFVGGSALAATTANRWWAAVTAVWTVGITLALSVYALIERVAGWGAVAMLLASIGTLGATLTLWFGRLPVGWFFVGPFAFRPAKERSSASHVRHSLLQVAVFWSFFLLFLPATLAWIEWRLLLQWPALDRPVVHWLGLAVFLAGSVVGLWSMWSMSVVGRGTPLPAATARELVVVGPYRFVRNPMAVAGAVQTVGVGLWLGSWSVLVAALTGCLVWNQYIRPGEEADLLARFGEPYRRYSREVSCWIPRRGHTNATKSVGSV
jgi:protein-S-isoprenylcysteine O-methyltransferase Ste14